MTHPTGLDYPHGTYLSYQHRPCSCHPCTTAWNVYRQQLQLRHNRGQVWADLDHYRKLLAPFRRAGVSPTAIYRATGLRPASVRSLMHATGRVRLSSAQAVDELTWDDLDDSTRVDADLMRKAMTRLRDRGVSWQQMADTLGWVAWPHGGYPRGPRVNLGLVRRLERLAGIEAHGWPVVPCEDCGAEPLAGGRWCLDCFNVRSLPQSRRELEVAANRRVAAERKRRERSAA